MQSDKLLAASGRFWPLLAVVLLGCEKEPDAQRPLSQKQQSEVQLLAANAKKSKVWADFLGKIERGEAKDPHGQYVSKREKWTGEGERPSRPKLNYEDRTMALDESGNVQLKVPCEDRPDDPDCIFVPAPPTFVSTEGQAPYNGPDNPNGYIYDLKLVGGASVQAPPPGYTRLSTDLNDHAGGANIHLCFVRNPAQVLLSREYYENKPVATGAVTNIRLETGCCSAPPPSLNYYNIWWYNPNYGWSSWYQLDLNNGAWGSHIWSYQTKGIGLPPIEVGILSGDNDRIQPPTGWDKLPTDLNQGAGGKFVYFCTKPR